MAIKIRTFGTLRDGRSAQLFTLTNANGTEASFTDMGAAWVSMTVQDRTGEPGDVLLGYDHPQYYADNHGFLGACVGRNANRIAGGSFRLDGKEIRLEKNDNNRNNLHSGPNFFGGELFQAETEESKLGSRVCFHLKSESGKQGYPGNLEFTVSYTLTDTDSVMIEYRAVSDETTIINPTNHAYFNLKGHGAGDILGQEVWINADRFTPVDPWLIPTGELRETAGTALDFTWNKPIGQDIEAPEEQITIAGGFDHNYVINGFDGTLRLAARVKDPESGRMLKVYTDLPGIQFYTGNFLGENQALGKGDVSYGFRAGYCLETQYFPDAVHHPEWKQAVFRAGEEYHHFTVYQFISGMDEGESD